MNDPCYTQDMSKSSEIVTLDEDVQQELKSLADRSGRSVDAFANAVLRAYVQYERDFIQSVERGLEDVKAGRVHTTDEVRARLEEHRRSRGR